MMPRLRAEEALQAVRIVQVSGGQFEANSEGQREAMKTLSDWELVANGGEVAPSPSAVKRETVEQKDERRKTRSLLGQMGVKIVQHKPKEETDDKS